MSALAASLVCVAYLASLFDADSDAPTVVANIQNARDVQGIAAGDPLITGQILNTPQGTVKINFQSGAKLALEGPAELEILGPNSARLSHGVTTVRVPGRIKGFVLVTPHERVTDLGTSVGVDVDRGQRTSISVFEGEVELASRKRVVAGEAVVMESSGQIPRSVPYTIDRFLDTWQVSFGLQSLVGDIRVATPEERRAPGQVEDTNSLLLIPERESVVLREGFWVDASAPGTYRRPLRKRAVQLDEDVRVDSFLLQYNPVRNADVPESNQFQGELHFDRPIVALILQRKLLDESDGALAFPESDFRGILHRGINTRDVVTLSDDRRVLKIAVDIQDGVDQIRVLVASDSIPQSQSK